MRTATLSLALPLLALVSAAPAFAQEAATQTARKKMQAGVAIGAVFPQGDADERAGTSPAVRGQFLYWIHPMVGLIASFDWVFVAEKDGVADTTYYDISVGVRVTTPGQARLKPFGEFQIGRHTVAIDDIDYDESDNGFRMGGGGTYDLGDTLQAYGEVTYSSVTIDFADIDAFVVEFGALARF